MPHIWRKTLGLMFCLALLVNTAGWLPTAQASWISTQQEINMGRSAAREIEKQYGLVQDQALQERVARIGNRIAAISDRKDLPYAFKVLDVKEINAFALPGGFIYVCKGLIDYMPSDDELAGVIGHEVGHVVKRHTVQPWRAIAGRTSARPINWVLYIQCGQDITLTACWSVCSGWVTWIPRPILICFLIILSLTCG